MFFHAHCWDCSSSGAVLSWFMLSNQPPSVQIPRVDMTGRCECCLILSPQFFFFCPEIAVCFFTSAAYMYIQAHFRLDFIMGANTMSPDQTAPFRAV